MKGIVAVLVILLVPFRAQASASILGFSVGEDSMVLSSILAEMVQQVAVLRDVSSFSRDMRDNIGFVKDVYGTANDVANARWAEVTGQFVDTIANADPTLRQLYQNTTAIVEGRVPRGSSFRRLAGASMDHFLFEAFGPYPFGVRGDRYAVADHGNLSLSEVATEQMKTWKDEHRAIKRAWDDCDGNLEDCERAGARMQTQSARALAQLKAIEAERAKQEALQRSLENGERRERDAAMQKDLQGIVNAAKQLRGDADLQYKGEEN